MSSTHSQQPEYLLPHATNIPEETKRLDDMHEGIKDYLRGALSFAPLESAAPKAILELGCGSGAWAIQAAKQFPDAEVLAVDLSPIPQRDLPQNLKFQTADLTKPFPFEPGTFDIVHARLVYIHLANFEDVLSRTIQLVRPGGWLLVEEIESMLHEDGGLSPGQEAFWKAFNSYTKTKGLTPLVGSALEGLLEASNCFSEVNVKKFVVPMSRKSDDMTTGKLDATIRTSIRAAIHALMKPETPGIAAQVRKEAQAEMDDPSRDLYLNWYFTWSRKRV